MNGSTMRCVDCVQGAPWAMLRWQELMGMEASKQQGQAKWQGCHQRLAGTALLEV